jgi:hypothetical protein
MNSRAETCPNPRPPSRLEIERLRIFLEPFLTRRGWTNSREVDDNEFQRRVKMWLETGLNVRHEVFRTNRGVSHVILTMEHREFYGSGSSPALAYFRAAEKLAREEGFPSYR